MKIRFLKDYRVQAENGEFYKAGEIYDLPELSAKHFLRKNRAEIVEETGESEEVIAVMEEMPTKIAEVEKPASQPKSRNLGEGGGDPVAKFQKGQREYRKKVFKGEE